MKELRIQVLYSISCRSKALPVSAGSCIPPLRPGDSPHPGQGSTELGKVGPHLTVLICSTIIFFLCKSCPILQIRKVKRESKALALTLTGHVVAFLGSREPLEGSEPLQGDGPDSLQPHEAGLPLHLPVFWRQLET